MKNKKQPYYGHDGKTNEEQMRAQQEEFLLNDQPPVFNPFKEQQVHRSGLFMMNGLAKASIAVLVILAFFLLGLFIGDFFAPSKSAMIGYYHTSIEDIYYASETIAVGTVVEVINPTEVRGRPYSNFNIALRENRLLKGTLTSGNEPPYLNIYQNKNDFKNKNGSYLKDKKEYLLFCGATFPNATREVRLINPLQGALEIKKDHIVKNKYSKMLGVAGMSVTEVMEQIKSIKKPLSCAPEVGTVPNLDEPVSSEVKG